MPGSSPNRFRNPWSRPARTARRPDMATSPPENQGKQEPLPAPREPGPPRSPVSRSPDQGIRPEDAIRSEIHRLQLELERIEQALGRARSDSQKLKLLERRRLAEERLRLAGRRDEPP